MKYLFSILFLVTVFFSACKVPVATIASKQVPVKSKYFVYENDTVRITYDFWGNYGAMRFEVYNKLDQSIYIDLKNSAFIPNENMISYWRDEVNSESASASGYLSDGTVASKGKSKSVRRERIIVIPPHSKIRKPTYNLIPYRNEINKKLEFRNYLAISTNEKFEGKVSYIDNEFYVSNVSLLPLGKARASTSPIKFYAAKDDIEDKTYVSFKN
jgi:hypothetical protein